MQRGNPAKLHLPVKCRGGVELAAGSWSARQVVYVGVGGGGWGGGGVSARDLPYENLLKNLCEPNDRWRLFGIVV